MGVGLAVEVASGHRSSKRERGTGIFRMGFPFQKFFPFLYCIPGIGKCGIWGGKVGGHLGIHVEIRGQHHVSGTELRSSATFLSHGKDL